MTTPLDDYKALIDDIVEQREDVIARWVTEKRPWPDLPENKSINDFVASLDGSQREVLAQMLQHSRDGGIHDVLGYLNEQIDTDVLRLTMNGKIVNSQFETEEQTNAKQWVHAIICDDFEISLSAEPLDNATVCVQLGLRPIGEHCINTAGLL